MITDYERGLNDAWKAARKVLKDYCKYFDNLPAADVRPVVHGKWIYCENTFGQDGWVCELCHYFVPWNYKERLSVAEEKLSHFCPNCGAQMEVEE